MSTTRRARTAVWRRRAGSSATREAPPASLLARKREDPSGGGRAVCAPRHQAVRRQSPRGSYLAPVHVRARPQSSRAPRSHSPTASRSTARACSAAAARPAPTRSAPRGRVRGWPPERACSRWSPGCPCYLESTDRSLTRRGAGLPESSAGVPAFAGRRRGRAGAKSRRSAPLGGAEGAGARVREACAGMLARASDPGRRCERASGRERYRP